VAPLAFCDVVKHYNSGGEIVRAVDGLSLEVGAGELVVIYGPSGAGKSTLLRIAAGIERPDAGAVLVDGRDVTRLSAREAADYRMDTLGWIGQEADLLEGATAVDNAAFKLLLRTGSLRRARRAVVPLLRDLGMEGRLQSRAETLSTGEQQRVMIARALSLDPAVILADEPTGSLDSQRSREVLKRLRDETHARGCSTIVVTHDEHAAEVADRVFTLLDGILYPAESPAPRLPVER
jgi:ABC-type lipoprotein export system ATPase subunit